VIVSCFTVMSSFSPTTPTLPSYKPVRRLSIPYQTITHGLFRRFSCDTAVSHDKDEEDHLLSNSSRECKSCVHNICGYVALALVSLLLGLVAGHFIRVEDNLNGYMSMLDALFPVWRSSSVLKGSIQDHTIPIPNSYKMSSGTRTVPSRTCQASSLK
jgi:hypothetical protein